MRELARKYTDVDINAQYRDLGISGATLLTQKRTALAEDVLKQFADKGLTVSTAEAVLKLAGELLRKRVNSFPVKSL